MKKKYPWLFCALLTLSVSAISWKPSTHIKQYNNLNNILSKDFSGNEQLEKFVENIYQSAQLQQAGLDLQVFKKGLTGFINLKIAKKIPANNAILTIVDFSKSSCEKRMWIINVIEKSLILNTLVAHGQASGEDLANHFSDEVDSHASSLGFYLTDDVYYGKNGRSLRLDGLDPGFNTHARERAIVIHAADYVSPTTIDHLGFLGRSFGCPAVSPEVADKVINLIKRKTVVFIYGNDNSYNSKYLNEDLAENFISKVSADALANL